MSGLNDTCRLALQAVLVAGLAIGCAAPRPAKQTPGSADADANERLLLTADTFTSSHISNAGFTPPEVHAFRALFQAPDARDRFTRVAQRATVAGQLFGLCGLYFLDPAAFERESGRLRRAGTRVQTMFGCIYESMTTSELLTPDPAARQLPHEWDPALWSKPLDGVRLDIPSGGHCYSLRSETDR